MPSEYEVGVILPPDIVTVEVGIEGLQGPAGTGVPAGGAVNDIIYKSGTADYTTAWTSIPTLDGVTFDTAAGLEVTAEGELVWDTDAGTIDLGLNGGAVLKVGEDSLIRVQADENISKGQVCIAVGTVGNSGVIKAARAVPTYDGNPVGSERIMGLALANIAEGERGYVVASGQVRKVNTLAFSEGNILWADPTVAGGLTASRPAAGNWRTIVAFVVTDSATVGCLQVRVTPGSDLGNDEKVDLTGQTAGDVLTYNGSLWVADAPAVVSVNGATGTVVLDAAAVGAIGTAATTDVITEGTTNLYNRVPIGGATGQALVKSSNTDYATEWAAPSPAVHNNARHTKDFASQLIPYPTVGLILPSYQGAPSFAGNILGGYMVAYPQPVPVGVTIDAISCWVETLGASSFVRLAIYKPRYDGTLTMDLVVDAGTVDASSTGEKTITLSPAVSLTENVYYLVASTQGTNASTVRVRTRAVANIGAFTSPQSFANYADNNGGFWGYFLNNGTTNAAFPNPVTFTGATTFPRPTIGLKVASIL